MSLKNLRSVASRSSANSRKESLQVIRKVDPKPFVPNLFIPSQLKWIEDTSPLCVFEKGRREGISFSESYRAVRDGFRGIDTTYSSYNFQSSKKFISNCAKWAKALNEYCRRVYHTSIIDEREILNYMIRFPNGAIIQAVSSNPEQNRDKEGVLVYDEFAFRTEQDELMKAGQAITIRGGQVRVISTHDGIDNDFNRLCNKIRSGEQPGSLHTLTFRDAVKEGMYRSMLAIKNEVWTKEKENIWMENVFSQYQGYSDEELQCIPRKMKGNQVFLADWFQYVSVDLFTLRSCLSVTYFDLASTGREDAKKGSFYSAYVQLCIVENFIIVYDVGAVQYDATNGNEWMRSVIKSFDPESIAVIENEPGSAAQKFFSYFEEDIQKHCGKSIESYTPNKSKLLRALPMVPYIRKRTSDEFQIVIHERLRDFQITNNITQESLTFVEWITKFDGSSVPLITDLTDCLSGGFDYVYTEVLSRF